MNANITKKQSMTSRVIEGHVRSYAKISMKCFTKAKKQFFHSMKYNLRGHLLIILKNPLLFQNFVCLKLNIFKTLKLINSITKVFHEIKY